MKPKASKNPESVVRKIKRKTRRKFNSEEKIRIIFCYGEVFSLDRGLLMGACIFTQPQTNFIDDW